MPKTDQGTADPADVSPELRHAEVLLKTGALQRAIFDSVNFSSIATDAKGVIQIFNVGAERMLGFTAAEVVNKITPAELSDPEELVARAAALSVELGTPIAPGFEALVFKASRGIEDIYELTKVRKDGSRFAAMVSVTALRDPEGTIIGYLLIGTDNTARKQAEEERATLDQRVRETLQQKYAAEEASRMKSELLANVSHELRTPLNAIIGFSEVLRDGLVGELSDQQRGFISDIFSSGTHLLALINDILDLSKVEAGKMTLDLEPVEVVSLFANSLAIVREKAAAREIQLHIDAAADLGTIDADVRKVKQIIYNLLSNAVKFSVDGGAVTLRARCVSRADVGRFTSPWPARALPLPATERDAFLELSVSDTGIGITEDGIADLFEPFSRIDTGLARKYEGSGLGLAMVKVLAALHGATAGVESMVGAGSRFTVWLPLHASPEARPLPLPELPQLEARTGIPVALVVEDDASAAELIAVQLAAQGFTVVHAANAQAGLLLAVEQPPSLITLDIELPDMDGWQFLGRLREVPALRRIPVVIISIAADRKKGFALGAAAVLQKPISRHELRDALVGIGLLPRAEGQELKVLVVDDDPQAVELIAVRILGLATTVLRAYGGVEAIATARRELPDLLVLDLMMPDANGFDVVAALNEQPETARIPILIVTARQVTAEDRAKLKGFVMAIIEKGELGRERFAAEVRRTMSGRQLAV